MRGTAESVEKHVDFDEERTDRGDTSASDALTAKKAISKHKKDIEDKEREKD